MREKFCLTTSFLVVSLMRLTVISELVDIDRFPTIAHWYSEPESGPIYGIFDEIDFKPIQAIFKDSLLVAKRFNAVSRQRCVFEPQRVLRPLATDLDLSFTTKDHEIPGEMNVAQRKRERALETLRTNQGNGFNPRLKVMQAGLVCSALSWQTTSKRAALL